MENLKTKIQELESVDDLDLLIEGDVVRAELETWAGNLMFLEKRTGSYWEYIFARRGGGVTIYGVTKENVEIVDRKIKSRKNRRIPSGNLTWYNNGDYFAKVEGMLNNAEM
jgi:hypothetical protein